jgi:hypothetical protein
LFYFVDYSPMFPLTSGGAFDIVFSVVSVWQNRPSPYRCALDGGEIPIA